MSRGRRKARKGRIHIKPSRRGSLHKMMGIPRGEKIGHQRLARAAHSGSRIKRRKAQFALNMGG